MESEERDALAQSYPCDEHVFGVVWVATVYLAKGVVEGGMKPVYVGSHYAHSLFISTVLDT